VIDSSMAVEWSVNGTLTVRTTVKKNAWYRVDTLP
jgi:hypothetical protein